MQAWTWNPFESKLGQIGRVITPSSSCNYIIITFLQIETGEFGESPLLTPVNPTGQAERGMVDPATGLPQPAKSRAQNGDPADRNQNQPVTR